MASSLAILHPHAFYVGCKIWRYTGNCIGQSGLIFMTHGLTADKICDDIRQVSLCSASFGIWHLTDYIWQFFKNRSFE